MLQSRRHLVLALSLSLSFSLALSFAAAPARAERAPRLEVMFVLDSTGSMSSAIERTKERVLAIASAIAAGEPRPDVRFGVVTFRDRGDDYVTRRWPLTDDWEATRAALASIRADGGGDTPESVIQALHEALRETAWAPEPEVAKIVYLIGDAPPKHYDDDPDIDADLRWAVDNGVVVHTIGCGGIDATGRSFFDHVARATEGHYHPLRGEGAVPLPTQVREVEAVEAAEERSRRPDDLAAVVSRTARTYSGELGVTYEDVVPITTIPIPLDARSAEASGLLGEHARIVRDARTWRLLWAAHRSTLPPPPTLAASALVAPEIDFHEAAVLVVSVVDGGLVGVSVGRSGGVWVVHTDRAAGGPRVAMFQVDARELPEGGDDLRLE